MKKKKITYDNVSFKIDRKRIFIYGGELQYFRIPEGEWQDRVEKAKAAFINTISNYIPWNWHEEMENKFNFKGERDIEEWIKIVENSGIYMLAKPGPFICAEWDFGAFPNWLIPKECETRCLDPHYIRSLNHGGREHHPLSN